MKPRSPRYLLLPLFFAATFAGCDSFQSASPDDCEAVLDHYIGLTAEEAGADGAWEKRFVKSGTKAIVDLVGESDEYIRHCKATMMKVEVRSCLRKKSTKSMMEDCGF